MYHCLVPDLPEHGRSLSEVPYSMDRAAAEVADLIHQRAHGGRAHVIGLSLGGQVIVALPNPRRVVAARLGHNWSLQAPELFTPMVRAWIEDQALPAGLLPA